MRTANQRMKRPTMTMKPYKITERWEYDYAKARDVEPLLNTRHFVIEPELRKQIQYELFGPGHTPQENEKFFRWVWEHKPHYCEECMKPLPNYSAVYCSHILTRGANPEMAHDPRNINILCFEHHNQWEQATTRQTMRIYPGNIRKIELLKHEYNIK